MRSQVKDRVRRIRGTHVFSSKGQSKKNREGHMRSRVKDRVRRIRRDTCVLK